MEKPEEEPPAGISGWEKLSPDARRVLCEMADLFLLGMPLTAEISIGQGACRTFDVRLGRESMRKIRKLSA